MELRPYQKRIANWLCSHPRACLSVGMGLGKTAAVLHFLSEVKATFQRTLNATEPSTVDYTQDDNELELPY